MSIILRGCAGALLALGFFSSSASAQTIPLQPDLAVDLTAPAEVSGGGILTYTLSVRNIGQVAFRDPFRGTVYFASTAANVVAVHSLPAGATFRSVAETGSFSCAAVGQQVMCTGGVLNAGDAEVITITANAPAATGVLNSSAVVDPTNTIAERSESNNSSAATTQVPQPDLTVRLVAPSTVHDSEQMEYIVFLDNVAPGGEATNVAFRLTLPPGSGTSSWSNGVYTLYSWFERAHDAGFTCSRSGDVLTCSGGRIESGATGAVEVRTKAPRANAQFTASVVVDANNAIAERDEGNNSASRTLSVNGRPDLTVSTRFGIPIPLLVSRGITITNNGVGPATNVELTIDVLTSDPPPKGGGADLPMFVLVERGFACVRVSAAPGPGLSLYEVGDRYRCTGGNLPAGTSATISMQHLKVGSSYHRRTRANVDPSNQIVEADETNNTVLYGQNVW